MFAKTSRILKKDVEAVIKGGATYFSPSFSVKVLKNSPNKALFTVVISKKTAKTAVLRNKNKRRVREIIRKNLESIAKYSFVVFIKKDISKIPHSEVVVEVLNLLARVA